MKHSDEEIIEICSDAKTMSKAAADLGMHFNTFKKHATRLGVYNPNRAGKGINKKHNGSKIELTSILEGNHPSYQTNKLRIRLIKEGIKSHECECCGVTKWLDNPISLELDHIDGNRNNHKLSNLRILCPNCHSQTSTYRGKNVG
mgnify:FL=1|jgi:5-methylcytosine-specific restriction endonuclease McrA|tara:strand:+ start:510 stop:944 length:435 start_codon:yes stop_codon:yes gene_type:complete